MWKCFVVLGFAGMISCCSDRIDSDTCKLWKDNYSFCQNRRSKDYCATTCKQKCTNDKGVEACGISKALQGRVVNGEEAVPGAWPWIISVQMKSGIHFCGGSLLTPNWVLTASHCVDGLSSTDLQVVLGAHNKNDYEKSQQQIFVKRIIMHPNYRIVDRSIYADVALLELHSPARLNDRVVTACMPQQCSYPKVGENCFVAGWGRLAYPRILSDPKKLHQAELPIVGTPHKGCHNNNEVVCVGYGFGSQPDGSQHPNACKGDSGGPLMCQRFDGRWVVEGVASYVYTYCKYFTAYAPVNKYLSWMKQYIPNL